jgi:hypothetical protein
VHDLAGASIQQDLPPRSITVPLNVQTFQFPAYFFSAVFDELSSGLQECIQVLREFIDLYRALLPLVNVPQQYFDNCAVNVTRALSADLLILRSQQLNCIARQFRIFWEAHRYTARELAHNKGKFRDLNARLTHLSIVLQPVHQKARLKMVCNFVLNLLIQCE